MEQSILNSPFKIKDVTFHNRIMNASGCNCTTSKDLLELASSSSGGIISKSCTYEYRVGNEMPRYYDNDVLSINSTGLANNGYEFYAKYGETIKSITDKPYIISVAGIKYRENIKIIDKLQQYENHDLIELNLSCPNIIGKSQIGYDFEASDELLRCLYEKVDNHNIGLKLPPYFDMIHFGNMADIIKKYPICYLTCINSLGNGFVFNDSMEPSIVPKNGFGGIGGSVIKPFGLANVRKFHELLPNIPIIGCGGITNKQDAYEYIKCGASLVQIGTQLIKTGPELFDILLK